MRRLLPPGPFGLLFLLLLCPAAGRAQSDDGGGAAPADTTEARELISTDGAVSVFTEQRPGEGIEGFWWVYDPDADLKRLLDKDRASEPLDPLLDPFGFELAIPDTIRNLRDSVMVVADSILAERIELEVTFDPKLTSSYTETKDRFVLSNEFTTSYPLVRNGNLQITLNDNQEFNESTKKVQDSRRVNSAFNYAFNPDLVSSFTLNWSDDLQERAGVTDSQSDNVTVGGTLRHTQPVGPLGRLESSGGISIGNRNYRTAQTDGQAGQVQPNWKARLVRDYAGGSTSLDYSGNFGLSTREERREVAALDSTVVDRSDETNFSNTVNAAAGYKWVSGTDLKFTGTVGRDQFQYISQVDSLQGQQETRSREFQDAVLNLTAKPTADVDLKSSVQYHTELTDFKLEDVKTRRTTRRLANLDLTYRSWEGGRWIFKMETSGERRDYRTNQAGDVIKQKASADFLQEITERIDFEAAYIVTLDRFEFDVPLSPSERDLRSQRGTFDVRYNPTPAITSAIRMEVLKTESINLYPPRSGDNDTEHGFTITPNYTWRVGRANFRGDFTADARYKVQDFAENDNTLNRRFALRQSWQQAISGRLSTETQYRWEFSDRGSYNRDPIDRKRRFSRSSESRRQTVEFKILYTVRKGVRTRVEYRHDTDTQYAIQEGEKILGQELPRRQFLYAIDFTKNLAEHVRLDLSFRQTLKNGENVSEVERNFYNIRAGIVYTPFHVDKKEGS